ncbi:MAG: NADH-quinone oxidoreductase subunit J [Bacillus sp. (in: firmicutes)]
MSFSGEMLGFAVLAIVAISGALLLLILKKVVHMVVAMVFTFISIAGLYVTLSAEFVAAVQILIYSGAITIMMLFGIMLTKHNDEERKQPERWRNFFVFIGVLVIAVTVYIGIYDLSIPVEQVPLHEANTEQIGVALYSKYIIPFELISILLLVALVGAVILAKRDDKEEKE